MLAEEPGETPCPVPGLADVVAPVAVTTVETTSGAAVVEGFEVVGTPMFSVSGTPGVLTSWLVVELALELVLFV